MNEPSQDPFPDVVAAGRRVVCVVKTRCRPAGELAVVDEQGISLGIKVDVDEVKVGHARAVCAATADEERLCEIIDRRWPNHGIGGEEVVDLGELAVPQGLMKALHHKRVII